ncbi:MAG: hypothetical protein JXB03_07670 [Spirochaetales bacterium]|nr:hypothetical protein [Spirochaetales bacterium]
MTMDQIKEKAKAAGVVPGKMKKVDLIRSIQTAEGNFPCFMTALNGECDQMDCLWRKECLQGR